MGHISYNKDSRLRETPEGWYGVTSAIGQLVNQWADRDDLVAYVSNEAGKGAPACYNPVLAEVEVNIPMSFGASTTPEMVGDLLDSKNRYNFPKTVGVLYHEAFHARFSKWSAEEAHKTLDKDEALAIMWLEETRAEKFGLDSIPRSKSFLRATATDIILDQSDEALAGLNNTTTCAFHVAVCHGRLLTGVLKESDVRRITSIVEGYFGSAVMAELLDILTRFQAHSNHHKADPALYDLAREWAKIVRGVAEEKGDSAPGEASELKEALSEAMREMAEDIAIDNQTDLNDQEMEEDWKEEVQKRNSGAQERNKSRELSKKVFGKGTAEIHAGTRSRLVESRPPTPAERGSAVRVARQLEKAKYRERDLTEITSVLPPGRLRPRTLIQAKALKERGVMSQVEPWRRKQRRQTDNPTLTVGVMVDISGSMSSAMEPMATTAWVLSEAVRRVQGRASMVYFGNTTFPTLKPGQHLEQVNVYSAPDGTEHFDEAFRALDGALDLTSGSGARLLVIVSDGHYTESEVDSVHKRLAQCERAGVAVLWLTFDNSDYSVKRYMAKSPATEFLTGFLDPVSASDTIGQSASRVLSRIGR